MRSLVLGHRGLIGNNIFRELIHRGEDVRIDDNNSFDLDGGRSNVWSNILHYENPEVIYFCSANAHVDGCEKDEGTWIPNVSNTIKLIREANLLGIRVVWFSSSYVFDGSYELPNYENYVTNPINSYGRQKVAVENFMRLNNTVRKNTIIRTGGVFGARQVKKNNLLYQTLSLFEDVELKPVNDLYMFNPISAALLAEQVVTLVSGGIYGLFHIGGMSSETRYSFALKLADVLDKEAENYVSPSYEKGKVLRPVNGVLRSIYEFIQQPDTRTSLEIEMRLL